MRERQARVSIVVLLARLCARAGTEPLPAAWLTLMGLIILGILPGLVSVFFNYQAPLRERGRAR